MGILKFILFSVVMMPVFLTAVRAETNDASEQNPQFKGGEVYLQSGAGPGKLFVEDAGARLKFLTGDLHVSGERQYSPVDQGNTSSPTKHVDTVTGGIEQDLGGKFSLGLDYDKLSDSDEQLYTDGVKLTGTYDIFHLSYRFARSVINQTFFVYEPKQKKYETIQGAFLYQSTLEASVDLPIGKEDTLTPIFAYSFFSPEVGNFIQLLSKKFARNLSSFTSSLQDLTQWSVGFSYDHFISERWGSSLALNFGHIIVGYNPSIEVNPALTRKWSEVFSTELGLDYVYIPGSPTYTGTLEFKYSFGAASE